MARLLLHLVGKVTMMPGLAKLLESGAKHDDSDGPTPEPLPRRSWRRSPWALMPTDEGLGVVLKELDARHRHARLQAEDGLG